jgi:hypothetical protein
MKKILMLSALMLAFAAAPALATENAARPDDHSGFGVSLFTNQSPPGFEDPLPGQSATDVASMARALADIAPAAGDDGASGNALSAQQVGGIIAPAVSGVTPPLSAQ